jgi:hypothetical protein
MAYPKSLDEIPAVERNQKNILWILSGPKLHYNFNSEGFNLSYNSFPLGPLHVYDSEKGHCIVYEKDQPLRNLFHFH